MVYKNKTPGLQCLLLYNNNNTFKNLMLLYIHVFESLLCPLLIKTTVITGTFEILLVQCNLKFLLNIFDKVIYSCDGQAEFSALL